MKKYIIIGISLLIIVLAVIFYMKKKKEKEVAEKLELERLLIKPKATTIASPKPKIKEVKDMSKSEVISVIQNSKGYKNTGVSLIGAYEGYLREWAKAILDNKTSFRFDAVDYLITTGKPVSASATTGTKVATVTQGKPVNPYNPIR